MSFFTSIRPTQQELELESAKTYIKELDMLEYFVRNVPLNTPSFQKTAIFAEVAKQLHKSFDIHKLKVIPLWMEFVQRANDEFIGITQVHHTLLSILRQYNMFKLALKLIQQPGLPIYISIATYQQYLLTCAEVYIEFQKYYEAMDVLTLANIIEDEDFELSFLVLKFLVLVRRILGHHIDRSDFERDITKVKVGCNRQLQELQATEQDKIAFINFEYEIFIKIVDEKELTAKELGFLKNVGLFELYQKIPNKQTAEIKQYIKTQIFNPTLYRVKQADLKNTPLHIFEIVRDINKIKPLYRSDAKNKTLYFIHQHSNQSKLDTIINKACTMQRIIKNRPIESRGGDRDENDEERFGSFGGMGGMRGMRGMGGLGGFGGFGGMGGMGDFMGRR